MRAVSRLSAALALATAAASDAAAAPPPRVDVVSFGLWGAQSVFASEAAGAARIVAHQFGHGGQVIVRANTKSSGAATEDSLRATLASLGAKMDPERDILFLILTSHGNQEGIGVATPSQENFITPIELRDMLRESGARLSVVVVSACYSGIFADALAEPSTLVITAADRDHASFGCRDGAKWTTFGEAFFADALARTKSLPDAFALARDRIAEQEHAEGYDPSNPQMAGGRHVLERLRAAAADKPRSAHADGRAGVSPLTPASLPNVAAYRDDSKEFSQKASNILQHCIGCTHSPRGRASVPLSVNQERLGAVVGSEAGMASRAWSDVHERTGVIKAAACAAIVAWQIYESREARAYFSPDEGNRTATTSSSQRRAAWPRRLAAQAQRRRLSANGLTSLRAGRLRRLEARLVPRRLAMSAADRWARAEAAPPPEDA